MTLAIVRRQYSQCSSGHTRAPTRGRRRRFFELCLPSEALQSASIYPNATPDIVWNGGTHEHSDEPDPPSSTTSRLPYLEALGWQPNYDAMLAGGQSVVYPACSSLADNRRTTHSLKATQTHPN